MIRCLALALLMVTAAAHAEELPDLSRGGLIELEAREYDAAGDYAPLPGRTLVLRGKGVGITKIKLRGGAAFLTLAGKLQESGKLTHNSQWAIENLTIDGSDLQADGIILENATGGSMANVNIQNFKGSAMRAAASWDCYFANCRFVRCGTEERPAWHAADATTDPPASSNVNNMVFVGCIFENNHGTYTHLGSGSTKNRFLGCKWHGVLPSPSQHDHVVCAGFDNAWQGCNFTNGGRSHVVMRKGAADNSFYGCHIGNTKTGWGIELNGTKNDVTGVVWSTRGGKNKQGNVKP